MLDKIIQELENKSYAFIPHLLNSDDVLKINEFIEAHKSEFTPAKVGGRDNKIRVDTIRGDYTFWLDPLNPPEEFKKLTSVLETLREEVNTRFFVGMKQFEYHLAYYPAGTFYKKHLDRFTNDSSRTLSFIFYLNQEWSPEDHGELILYNDLDEVVDTLIPTRGSFVCFFSDVFPHEVKSSIRERRSLTGWMHNKLIY